MTMTTLFLLFEIQMQYNNNIVLVVWGAGEMWCLQYLLFDTIVKHDNNDTLVIGDGNTIPALWESGGIIMIINNYNIIPVILDSGEITKHAP